MPITALQPPSHVTLMHAVLHPSRLSVADIQLFLQSPCILRILAAVDSPMNWARDSDRSLARKYGCILHRQGEESRKSFSQDSGVQSEGKADRRECAEVLVTGRPCHEKARETVTDEGPCARTPYVSIFPSVWACCNAPEPDCDWRL